MMSGLINGKGKCEMSGIQWFICISASALAGEGLKLPWVIKSKIGVFT